MRWQRSKQGVLWLHRWNRWEFPAARGRAQAAEGREGSLTMAHAAHQLCGLSRGPGCPLTPYGTLSDSFVQGSSTPTAAEAACPPPQAALAQQGQPAPSAWG